MKASTAAPTRPSRRPVQLWPRLREQFILRERLTLSLIMLLKMDAFNMIDPELTQPIINGVLFRLSHPKKRQIHEYILPHQYWQYHWSCGYSLATVLIELDGTGKRYLELGPGLGLCSAIATQRKFSVTVVDREIQALEYTTYNIKANDLPEPTRFHTSWKEFATIDAGMYDVIAAGDCCYDPAATHDILQVVKTKLAPGGVFYATDQLTENYLLEALKRSGLMYTQTSVVFPIRPELPARYDRQNTCLFTITIPDTPLPTPCGCGGG